MMTQGTYIGRIIKWGLSEASTGTPQFFTTFQLMGRVDPSKPDDAENLIPCEDWERTVFRAITDKTIEFVVRDLRTLGYNHNTFDQLDPAHDHAHDFAGMEIRVTCKHDTYQGKEKERWDFAFGGGYTPKAMETSGLKKLNAMFGKTLKSTSKAPSKAENAAASKARADAAEKEMHEVL